MSQIGRALRLAQGLARSPARVEQTYGVAANANHVVLLVQQQLEVIEARLADFGPQWTDVSNTVKTQAANVETLQTSQLEALTYLNRTLRELSERVAALEKATAANER